MSSFVKASHIGFACVYYADTKDSIRWGIGQSWSEPGKQKLARTSASVSRGPHPSSSAADAAVQRALAEQLVQIVANPVDHPHIPAHSSALMHALDVPCYLVASELPKDLAEDIADKLANLRIQYRIRDAVAGGRASRENR